MGRSSNVDSFSDQGLAQMNPFYFLGIPNNSTKEQIEKAFREKARYAHPDRGGSSEEFTSLMKAKDQALQEWLSNESIRVKCETCLDTGKVLRKHGSHSIKMTCPSCHGESVS